MKSKITIMIVCVLMVCIGIATQSGAGETYNISGEWDAVFNTSFGVTRDIIKISQEGDKFVGVMLIGSGSIRVTKGKEAIKGELIGTMINQVSARMYKSGEGGGLVWRDAQGIIIEEGNKIVIQFYKNEFFVTLSMTRKK